MNLKLSHFPLLLVGVLVGAAFGYLVGHVLQGIFPQAEDAPALGLMFGALGGVGIVVLTVLISASRDPEAEPPTEFTSVNGIGSTLYGKSDFAEDGSYVATEWFTFFFVPIFPVCSYRVISTGGTFVHSQYKIVKKLPLRAAHVIKEYLVTLALAAAAVLAAMFVGGSG